MTLVLADAAPASSSRSTTSYRGSELTLLLREGYVDAEFAVIEVDQRAEAE